MTFSISKRGDVAPFYAMDVLADANRLIAQGADVISMAVGQPSDPAPLIVREAARRALEIGRVGYTDAMGIAPLRAAISEHYLEHYGLEVAPARICVTTGSSAGFNLAFLALFDAGERVAIASPGYPAYRNIMAALGLEVVEIDLHGHSNLTLDLVECEHARKPIKGMLFAAPANPTGATIAPDELERLVRWGEANGVAVISDEIYHRLNYSGADRSALEFGVDPIIINSFSKYYCMTGWRIGWMVLPERLTRSIERIQQSLYISAPALSQVAAVEAFKATDELEAIKARYAANRDLLSVRLPALGIPLAAPMDGAFYAYCDVSRVTNDSMEFARLMLREAHVAATPGRDFDVAQGHRTMRFSYAGSHEDMLAATDRLANWLKRD